MVALVIGIMIGIGMGTTPVAYQPLPPPVTTDVPTFDDTMAIVVGAVGAAVLILVAGFILLKDA